MNTGIVFAVFCLIFGSVHMATADEASRISITVSPKTLVVHSLSECVTVHTNIRFVDVAGETVELELKSVTVIPYLVKSDDRGYLVAKFNSDDIKQLIEDESEVTMTLTGLTVDGTPFTGSDTIKVISPKGK